MLSFESIIFNISRIVTHGMDLFESKVKNLRMTFQEIPPHVDLVLVIHIVANNYFQFSFDRYFLSKSLSYIFSKN